MRQYDRELQTRVAFLQKALRDSGAVGFVYGNSGGKDSALVGILCKRACQNTLGVILPCGTSQSTARDIRDALDVAEQYQIATKTIDMTEPHEAAVRALRAAVTLSDAALTNIAPRLRMTALYAIAAAENRLVVGTDNRSEIFMGYFTKWGDGAYDLNPIADLLVCEVYAFLDYLDAPQSIRIKAPSAGLFEGQTDEQEMGISYAAIDTFLTTGQATEENIAILNRYHTQSEHKRHMPSMYRENVTDSIKI